MKGSFVSSAQGDVKTVGSSVTRILSISVGQLIQISTAREQQMTSRPISISLLRVVDDIGIPKLDLAILEERKSSQVIQ
jgi:hypothetical protein